MTNHHSENRKVTEDDVGTDRPITVDIAKPVFESAFDILYEEPDDFEDNL